MVYCLGIDITLNKVTVQFYQNFTNQNWYLAPDEDDITTIISAYVNNSNYYNKPLFYDEDTSSWLVDETGYMDFGLIESTNLSTSTSPQMNTLYLANNERYYANPTGTAYKDGTSGYWMNWSTSNSNILSVSILGRVHAQNSGTATLYFQDIITGNSGSCTVSVHHLSNGRYSLSFYDSETYYIRAGSTINDPLKLYSSQSHYWYFKMDNASGYFTIRVDSDDTSVPDNQYMSLQGSAPIEGTPVILYEHIEGTPFPDKILWEISANNGSCTISPINDENLQFVIRRRPPKVTVYGIPIYISTVLQFHIWQIEFIE